MYYPDELIEEVRMRNDIVEVISSYVRLQKKGSNYFGLCPFHSEKSPSFSVSPQKQIYYCFGCGAGGNVITFIMEYENFTFSEALKLLADRVGIDLPEVTYSEEQKKQQSLKSKILEVNKEAGKFYYYQLRNDAGSQAMKYLTGRGLSEDTIKKFGLGYARVGQNLLYQYLKSKGFSDDLLRQSGIFNYDERNGMMDKFFSRVIFPIMDINHRIIGFGGRTMGEAKPKYLNSPETPVFDKGRNLYGLNHARTSRKKNMILCEGYMDVIAMHQAGFNQAVASLGTAFTSGQANLLKRYTEEVLLTYDSDEAGTKAALRAIPILKEAGINGRVINLAPYKDPDEFIKNEGAEAFEERIAQAENSFYFEIRMLERDFDLKDPHGKTRFAEEVAKKLMRFTEELERDNYTEAIADKYYVNRESLRKLVIKYAMQSEGITLRERPRSGVKEKAGEKEGLRQAQRMLLTYLSDRPKVYEQVAPYLSADDFTEDVYRKVAEMLFEQINSGQVNPAAIISRFEDESDQRAVAEVFNTPINVDTPAATEKAIKELLINVRTNAMNQRPDGDLDNGPDSGSNKMDAIQKMIYEKQQTEAISRLKLNITD